MRCMQEGEDFDDKIKNRNKQGRKICIVPGSVEENLNATWMEAHCVFWFTAEQINEHQGQQGLEGVSRYCVMSAFYRLQLKIDVLQKVVSGGHNEKWIQARQNVTQQMQVMQGRLTRDKIMVDPTTALPIYGPPSHPGLTLTTFPN